MRCIAAALIALLGAAIAGCGDSRSASAQTPAGYARYRGDGVSFAYPRGWRVRRDPSDTIELKGVSNPRYVGGTTIEITDPTATATPGPKISMSILLRAGYGFDSLLDQRRVVVEDVERGRIDARQEVKVDGAEHAVRWSTTAPAGGGSDPVAVRSVSLTLERDDGIFAFLIAAAPERADSRLDPGAVIDSFRLSDG